MDTTRQRIFVVQPVAIGDLMQEVIEDRGREREEGFWSEWGGRREEGGEKKNWNFYKEHRQTA